MLSQKKLPQDNIEEKDLRLIQPKEAEALINKIIEMNNNKGDVFIRLNSWWQGEMRWARNRVNLGSDRRDIRLTFNYFEDDQQGLQVTTNQIDDESLKGMISASQRSLRIKNTRGNKKFSPAQPILPLLSPAPAIWSDNTLSVTSMMRAELAANLSESAEQSDLLSAGYLEMRGGTISTYSDRSYRPEPIIHAKYSQSQCSMTVRHPFGTGSGWAGRSSYDWAAIAPANLASRALEKCLASLDPVAVEPGRYTVILEPQATADLINPLVEVLNNRILPEGGRGPFVLGHDETLDLIRTKLGMKIVDERINISHDPSNPALGIVPIPGLAPIEWIKNGVLNDLSYERYPYAVEELNDNIAIDPRGSYRMSGGDHSVDDLIIDTKRGLLVTRIWGVAILDPNSLLLTGVTRDGLWLIENGKITKAIKNFRITESPLFMLNQVDKLGTEELVFSPVASPYIGGLTPIIAPYLKALDFSFTSLVDAI